MAQTFKTPEPVLPDFSGIAQVPQLFLAAKNQRRIQDRADRHAAVQESYSRLKEARDAELHRAAMAREERQRQEDLANAGVKAYGLASTGQTGAANLLTAAKGIKMDIEQQQQPEPLAPLPPAPEAPANAFEGPLQAPPPELGAGNSQLAAMRLAGIEGPEEPPPVDVSVIDKMYADREMAMNTWNAQRQGHQQMVAQRPQAEAAHAAAVKAAAQPRITMTMPGAEPISFDPREQEMAKKARDAEMADGLMKLALDPTAQLQPHVRQQMLMTAMQIKAGLAGADKAALTGAQAQQAGFENNKELQTQKDAAALQRAQVAAAARRKRGAGAGGPKLDPNGFYVPDTGERTAEGLFNSTMASILSQNDFKKIQDEYNKNITMLDEVMSSNPAMHTMLGGSFAKMAQGWTGVLSDADMNVFWHDLGGVGERAANSISLAISGLITKGKQAQVEAALRKLMQNTETRRRSVARKLVSRIKGSVLRGREQVALDSFFGTDEEGRPVMTAQDIGERSGTAKPTATPVSAAAGATKPQYDGLSDQELDARIKKAKAELER